MAGVVRNRSNKKFSCMVGHQDSQLSEHNVIDIRESVSIIDDNHHSNGLAQTSRPNSMMFAQTGAQPEQLAQTGTSSKMRSLSDMPEDTRLSYAQLINSQDLPWKASAYTATELA